MPDTRHPADALHAEYMAITNYLENIQKLVAHYEDRHDVSMVGWREVGKLEQIRKRLSATFLKASKL